MDRQPEPSLDEISIARLGIEYLILALDYAMWLHITHEGQPEDVPASLVRGPEEGHSAAIDEYLDAHRKELSVRCLTCRKCGWKEWDLQTSHIHGTFIAPAAHGTGPAGGDGDHHPRLTPP